MTRGTAAEIAAHDAAAFFGLPDFAFEGGIRRVGSGVREVGDRVIVVGDVGLVLQVKSRSGRSADHVREQRWILKHANKGLRQANGSIRALTNGPRSMTNARDRTIDMRTNDCRWVAVVIVDHDAIPENTVVSTEDAPNPSVVVSRRDWEFLWQQLKSTSAVARYLERVASQDHELGVEALRYYDLAQADLETAQEPESVPLLGQPGFRMRSPLLPLAPAGTDQPRSLMLVRAILEDLATAISDVPELYRVRYLALLDSLTVVDREGLGEFMLQSMTDVMAEASPDGASWRFRTIVTPGPPEPPSLHLGFAACSVEHGEDTVSAFEGWIRLRRRDLLETGVASDSLTTLGVLLTPKPTRRSGWDTTLLSATEWLALEDDEVESLRSLFPLSAVVDGAPTLSRQSRSRRTQSRPPGQDREGAE